MPRSPLLDCSIHTFDSVLEKLESTWSSIWPTFAVKNIRGGLSFGSCYTVCGSLGYTNVSGVDILVPNTTTSAPGGPIVHFTNCGLVDKAMIVVPLDSTTITFDMIARATGMDILWPDDPNVLLDAHLSGYLLISIPRIDNILEFSKPEVDISFQAIWDPNGSNTWPEQSSILFPSVPTDDILKNFTTELQREAREDVVKKIRNALQSPDTTMNCSWPLIYAQTCSAGLQMPVGPCHPCDTCCKCLIQQRCDGECEACPCVNCHESTFWKLVLFLAAALMIIVSVSAIVSWQQ
jgi:hypothetical protein